MDILQVLGVVGLIISIPTAIGAGLALVRASYNKAQTEQLRAHNEDLRKRVADVEHSEAALKEEVALLRGQNSMLGEMVTQRADLANHHTEVMANYDAMAQVLGQMMALIKEVLKHVSSKS